MIALVLLAIIVGLGAGALLAMGLLMVGR